MIYLDYNATAPYSDRVADYLKTEALSDWGNASSEHDLGHRLFGKIKNTRRLIADFLGHSTKNLFFTCTATESINSVLSLRNIKQKNITKVITSPLEHHAVKACCDSFKDSKVEVSHVKHDQFGNIDLEHLESLCQRHPQHNKTMISLASVNNETGVIAPMQEIIDIAHRFDCLVHLDAVQALGKCPLSLDELNVDFASFSGHKIGSFKGVGLLYVKSPDRFSPFMLGGGQERGMRAGTYNASAIYSLGLAIQDIDFANNNAVQEKRDFFEKEFLALNPSFEINSLKAPRVSNTSNVYIKGHSSGEIMRRLALKDIYVSTGSACSSGNFQPSHVIRSMRKSEEIARSSLRVSLGPKTTTDEISLLLDGLEEICGGKDIP